MKRRLIGAITFIVIFFSLSLNVFAANGAFSPPPNRFIFKVVDDELHVNLLLSTFYRQFEKDFIKDFIFNRENSEYTYFSIFSPSNPNALNIYRISTSKISSIVYNPGNFYLYSSFQFLVIDATTGSLGHFDSSENQIYFGSNDSFIDYSDFVSQGGKYSTIPFRCNKTLETAPIYNYDVDPYEFFGISPPVSSTPSSEPSSTPSSEPSSTPSSSDDSSSFPSIPTIPEVDDKYLGFSPKTFENIFSAASTSIGSIVTVCILVLISYTGIVLVIKLIRYFLE